MYLTGLTNIMPMRGLFLTLFALMLMQFSAPVCANAAYIGVKGRLVSPGNTRYFIDAQKGDDNNTGASISKAWKTFAPVNKRIFSAGDRVVILNMPDVRESLFLVAHGNSKKHVKLIFSKGTYNFYPATAYKRQFFISNTNDDTYTPKAIAIYIDSSSYVDIEGTGAKMLMRGKMIETCVDHSQNISIHGLTYDYYRPTVSELTVANATVGFADLKIHPDSKYSIKDSLLTWEGEGWRYNSIDLWQQLDPATGDLQRIDIKMDGLKYAEISPNLVRVFFKTNPGFKKGLIYQNRDVTRDCTGIFLLRSSNLQLKSLHVNFMHGMGVVSQFSRDITIDSVFVRPAANSGRTCAAWADILHFSGCRGKVNISNSYLSGANDDAINVHGTYLGIINKPQPNQLLLRFMHSQTFGFEAFSVGDSVALVHSASLLQYGNNVVTKAERVNDKDILLTLKQPMKETIQANDVVENTTWTPQVMIRNNIIARIPTRGVLVTTRRKVIIENNTFQHTHYSGISIADDAASWFESGMVKDVLISNNRFNLCGGPVVTIAPENTVNSIEKVHNHISITNNTFNLLSAEAVFAKSTANVGVTYNIFNLKGATEKETDLAKFQDCFGTKVSGNKINP
jgi:hypothetical protein